MNLVKWNNRSSIFNDIDNWFNLVTNNSYNNFGTENEPWNPNYDIIQNKDNYLVQFELAGINKKDISIEIIENTIKISGVQNSKNKDSNNSFYQTNYGNFEKSFELPENILDSKITAKMNNGLLQITIPIAEPVLPESIKVKIN